MTDAGDWRRGHAGEGIAGPSGGGWTRDGVREQGFGRDKRFAEGFGDE